MEMLLLPNLTLNLINKKYTKEGFTQGIHNAAKV